MALPLYELPQENLMCDDVSINCAIREMENGLVGP